MNAQTPKNAKKVKASTRSARRSACWRASSVASTRPAQSQRDRSVGHDLDRRVEAESHQRSAASRDAAGDGVCAF